MKKIILGTFCAFFMGVYTQEVQAQKDKSPAKLAKEAAEFEKAGDYLKAAVYYETAYNKKTDNIEWVYQAGRCFLYMRDYTNAVKCLEKVKDQDANTKFDKPGYKYALALKQTGQYEKARQQFEEFIAQYKGADAEVLRKIVEAEVKGCNFALKASESTDAGVALQHLPALINTDKIEFAPIAFNDGVLYFTSTQSGNAAIYRTQKNASGMWVRPSVPDLFKDKMDKPNFGNGSFSPDGKRFYFTQCDLGVGGKPTCAIYGMVEEDGKWVAPFKLPDYINVADASNTHPFVAYEEDKEVLYFSSDRKDGKGGADIWFCTRVANSKGFNFTLPKNLGTNINTVGNEITPFYHSPSQTLYFSSDGWVGAGGMDIYKSKGTQLKWEVSQNLGFPLNSSADDLYFTINESHGGGYLVSNRLFEPTKVATTNDDIFFYGQNKIEVTLKGKVFDCKTKADGDAKVLSDVSIKLFEKTEAGEELVDNKMLAFGEYKFVLQPKKEYLIEMSREGFATSSFEVNTFEFKRTETHTKDICLELPSQKIEDIRATIVPLDHNSRENPYRLPTLPPTDPTTKQPYVEGSSTYKEFKRIEAIAELSPEHKVYYDGDGGDIIPFMGEVKPAVVAENPEPKPNKDPKPGKEPKPKKDPKPKVKSDSPNTNFTPDKYVDETGDVTFRVQVAAVRQLREEKYADLKGITGLKLDFEPLGDDLTRVMLVPDADGEKGFKSKAKALDALIYILDNTRFKTAFVARYEGAERKGEGFRGWDEEKPAN